MSLKNFDIKTPIEFYGEEPILPINIKYYYRASSYVDGVKKTAYLVADDVDKAAKMAYELFDDFYLDQITYEEYREECGY